MKVIFMFLTALATLSSVGCVSFNTGLLAPRPNVDVDPGKMPASLVISNDVPDSYSVPTKSGIPGFTVTNWRETLTAGYNNSFATSTRTSKTTLQILRAEIDYGVMSATLKSVTVVNATVTYDARLIDSSGKIIKRSAGTVSSKSTIVSVKDIPGGAQSAVESMYEKIAADFFGSAAG